MADSSRIVLDDHGLAGKPAVRGARLSVEFVLGLLVDGWSGSEVFENYPKLRSDCLGYARDARASEKVYPSAA